MKNKIYLILIALFIGIGQAKSDEGMFLLTMLEQLNLQEKGLELTNDQIYSINNASVKDAIVGLGTEGRPFRHFCTGNIVSDQGLMLTNHHCGFGQIQAHSSVEHDYLTDGFWAMSLDEELPNEGLTASFLIRIENVTKAVLEGVTNETAEEERGNIIRENAKKLEEKAVENTHYKANVNAMFEGNQYFLFVYEIFNDVRLVGAPPSSIGKFGGDTDNWMWPRHTGDFSVFRVYSGPDGKPAAYSQDNIPLKPKHSLPVSLEGYEEGDFSMIVGYPGGTTRYLTSYGINEQIETALPARIKARTEILSLMKEDMNESDEVRIKYSSKYYRISNGWKYFIGQRKGLKRLKVYDKKKEIEDNLQTWINNGNDKYAESIDLIEQAYDKRKEVYGSVVYLGEALFSGHEIINYAFNFNRLNEELKKDNPDQEKINSLVEGLKEGVENYFKDYNLGTDKKILASMMKMYAENVPKNHHPDLYELVNSKYKGNIDAFVNKLYAKSIFTSKESVLNFLNNPSSSVLEKDLAFIATNSFDTKFNELRAELPAEKLRKGRRLFLGALLEMNNDKLYYPDANSTMRLSYATIGGFEPRDAVTYDFITTTNGILEKEDPNDEEFIVDERLKELIQKEDFGPYADKAPMKVCYLGDHDSTGGNSGTGVLNGKGELTGLLFDGNWEAMSGDIFFETPIQKSINVDIRYVLFVIDRVCGAKHLVDEMVLVKAEPKPEFEKVEETLQKAE
jgi:Peptidase S46